MQDIIEKQRNRVKALQIEDNELLKECVQTSLETQLPAIREYVSYVSEIKINSEKRDEDILALYCERRIWFWSIRIRYVTGKNEYKLPSLPKKSRKPQSLSKILISLDVPVGYYEFSEFNYTKELVTRSFPLQHTFRALRKYPLEIHHYVLPQPLEISKFIQSTKGLTKLLGNTIDALEEGVEKIVSYDLSTSMYSVPQQTSRLLSRWENEFGRDFDLFSNLLERTTYENIYFHSFSAIVFTENRRILLSTKLVMQSENELNSLIGYISNKFTTW